MTGPEGGVPGNAFRRRATDPAWPPDAALKRVVVVGGGSGSFNLLTGLRQHPVWLQSIVTMMDSGGDSGELRDAFGVLPPGDLRRCLVALSEESQLLRDLFAFRFEEDPLRGRNFGNLFLLALTLALGSEAKAVDAMARILKIRGQVFPVTWDHSHLIAELENGEIVRGESGIDTRDHSTIDRGIAESLSSIRRVYLEPSATANPSALEAFASCDAIVFAPGDVFTSTIPNLLVEGVRDAVSRSPAPLVYVLNLMTKIGETAGWSASRHVEEIVRYGGRMPDALLVHEGDVPVKLLEKYARERATRVDVDGDRLRAMGVRTIRSEDLMSTTSLVRHDPERTAAALMHLLEELWARKS